MAEHFWANKVFTTKPAKRLFIQILYMKYMNTRHDLRKPNCQRAEPQKFVSHSNGTVFYLCKNCNYLGRIEAFTKNLHISEISQ